MSVRKPGMKEMNQLKKERRRAGRRYERRQRLLRVAEASRVCAVLIPRRWRRQPHCTADYCKWGSAHRHCRFCNAYTCDRRQWVDPQSQRRRVGAVCSHHPLDWTDDSVLRLTRTNDDWDRGLPDQYPGPLRASVRSFMRSSQDERLLAWGSAGAVNECLLSLGLGDEAYAETRGREVWIRRVPSRRVGRVQ